jgi:hypothetical protein
MLDTVRIAPPPVGVVLTPCWPEFLPEVEKVPDFSNLKACAQFARLRDVNHRGHPLNGSMPSDTDP